jgi:hypothetical protein
MSNQPITKTSVPQQPKQLIATGQMTQEQIMQNLPNSSSSNVRVPNQPAQAASPVVNQSNQLQVLSQSRLQGGAPPPQQNVQSVPVVLEPTGDTIPAGRKGIPFYGQVPLDNFSITNVINLDIKMAPHAVNMTRITMRTERIFDFRAVGKHNPFLLSENGWKYTQELLSFIYCHGTSYEKAASAAYSNEALQLGLRFIQPNVKLGGSYCLTLSRLRLYFPSVAVSYRLVNPNPATGNNFDICYIYWVAKRLITFQVYVFNLIYETSVIGGWSKGNKSVATIITKCKSALKNAIVQLIKCDPDYVANLRADAIHGADLTLPAIDKWSHGDYWTTVLTGSPETYIASIMDGTSPESMKKLPDDVIKKVIDLWS